MNRNEDRWQQCYWKEWAMIKKRWDELEPLFEQAQRLAKGKGMDPPNKRLIDKTLDSMIRPPPMPQ